MLSVRAVRQADVACVACARALHGGVDARYQPLILSAFQVKSMICLPTLLQIFSSAAAAAAFLSFCSHSPFISRLLPSLMTGIFAGFSLTHTSPLSFVAFDAPSSDFYPPVPLSLSLSFTAFEMIISCTHCTPADQHHSLSAFLSRSLHGLRL